MAVPLFIQNLYFIQALRQVDPSFAGFQSMEFADLEAALRVPTDLRMFAVGKALIDKRYTIDEIHDITKIDRWFLGKLQNIVDVQRLLEATPTPTNEILRRM